MQRDTLFGLLNRFDAARVLGLGDVMLDRFVYGSVERISPEGPMPVLAVEGFVGTAGGAANVARNLAAMGARTLLLGVTGNDAWAEELRIQLASSPTIQAHLVV